MSILIEPKQLAAGLGRCTVIDLRSTQDYDTAHIQGAVSLPADFNAGAAPFKTTVGYPDPVSWAAALGGCGVCNDSVIVAYDDGDSGRAAARFWFVARQYGHRSGVYILNGGFDAAAKYLPITTDAPRIVPAIYTPIETPGNLLDLNDILPNFDRLIFLDVRSYEEYIGTDLRNNPRGGHIRGAILLDMKNFFADAPGQSFASPKKLEQTMTQLGIRKTDYLVTY